MVAFTQIPSALRVPFFYAELSAAKANTEDPTTAPALIMGQKVAAGSAPLDTPVKCGSVSEALSLFGKGSILVDMVEAYRAQDPFGELYCLAATEAGGGTAATGAIVFGGTATAAGVVDVMVAGQRVQVSVASGDAAADVATAVAAAITALSQVSVTAAAATVNVNLTATAKGTMGSEITVHHDYHGENPIPAGLTITLPNVSNGVGYLSGGATNPTLTDAIAALGDTRYRVVAHPWTDATSLAALQTEFGDATGRWSWGRQIYGHHFTAKRETVANLGTYGNALNDPHGTSVMVEPTPSNPWQVAAAAAAAYKVSVDADPGIPVTTVKLQGILPAPQALRFTASERNTLLYDGIATTYSSSAGVFVERLITTYQTDAQGNPDNSYLDVQTLAVLELVLLRLRSRLTGRLARKKIVSDGNPVLVANVVTPSIIRGEIIAEASDLVDEGYLENLAIFKNLLTVERNGSDPTRVDVYFPPDVANPLRVIALLTEFRLQYAGT
jgi:phage tail sheath gpL-like